MEVSLLGSALQDQLFQNLPSTRFRNHQDIGLPQPAPKEILNPSESGWLDSGDRVELSGDSLIYYASQQFSYENSLIEFRPDGTYSYRRVSVEADQEIAVIMNFDGGSIEDIDLDAAIAQIEGIVEDLQKGFQDSLQDLVQVLRPTEVGAQSTAGPMNSLSEMLSPSDKELLSKYLVLLKQLSGDGSYGEKLVSQLENMLGLLSPGSKSSSESTPQSSTLNIEMSFEQMTFIRLGASVNSEGLIEMRQEERLPSEGEPLVLDLDGDGVELRSLKDGVEFDIDNDGKAEKTAFVKGDDALLALDKNGNGQIDGVAELFGDRTGAANGFEDLSRYDSNQDGKIDKSDPIYDSLLVFQDKNGDGRSSRDELTSLAMQGIISLDLHPVANPMEIAGNRITETSYFTREDGSKGEIAEVYFKYREI